MAGHPKTKAERRKVALWHSISRHKSWWWQFDPATLLTQPFRWDDQDRFDCGNAHCGLCSNRKFDYLKRKGYRVKFQK